MASSGEHALMRSLDYPCTNRLRLRRLLAYHRRYSNEDIYDAMKVRTTLIFHVKYVMDLVERGQWREASKYTMGILLRHMMSYEANLLLSFMDHVMVLNLFADGRGIVARQIANWLLRIYRDPALDNYPYFATIVADVLFQRSDHTNAFFDWGLVRKKAAKMIKEMVFKTPELKDKLHPPRGPKDLYHVVPIRPPSCRRMLKVKKNDVSLKQSAGALARFYLKMKKRLPSESQETIYSSPASANISSVVMMELLDEALKAGSSLVLEEGRIPEYFNECFPFTQTLSRPPFFPKLPKSQVHQPGSKAMPNYLSSHAPPEHSSKDISHARAWLLQKLTQDLSAGFNAHSSPVTETVAQGFQIALPKS